MRLSDFFQRNDTAEPTHEWTLVSHDPDLMPIDSLAEFLADKTMAERCIGCPHHYEAWKQRFLGGPPLKGTSALALEGFIRPFVGLPGQPPMHPDHLQGVVSQYLWYFLVLDLSAEPIERVERPGFAAIDHGGDGMVIHRASEGYLMFRLWEIKKSTGESSVSSTVNTAYKQLKSKAPEYLARYTSIGQELPNAELAEFYSRLPDLWLDGSREASAGVSVTTNVDNVPTTCFTTFGNQFPHLITPNRLRGMLTAIEDFPSFSEKVQKAVWKGL
jgi:hypothetical protein